MFQKLRAEHVSFQKSTLNSCQVEVEIHLLSFSGVAEQRRMQIHAFQASQNAQALPRMFRLGYRPRNGSPPPRDVILVCSQEVHPDLLEYAHKIMEYRGISPGSLQILVPENNSREVSVIPGHLSRIGFLSFLI